MPNARLLVPLESVRPLHKDLGVNFPRIIIQANRSDFTNLDAAAAHGRAGPNSRRLVKENRVGVVPPEQGRKAAENHAQNCQDDERRQDEEPNPKAHLSLTHLARPDKIEREETERTENRLALPVSPCVLLDVFLAVGFSSHELRHPWIGARLQV